jgi:hypothetical protein
MTPNGDVVGLWSSRNPLIAAELFLAVAFCVTAFGCGSLHAQQSTESLAAAAQNPVAAMYSLPFQNNTYFGAGPRHDQSANVLNIQPVLPFTVGNWNIISRTIVPLIALPSITSGLEDITTAAPSSNDPFGLGDINQTFISPRQHGAHSSGASVRHSTCRRRPNTA